MQKNVAGQKIGAQLVSATDGSAFTGSVTVYVTGDAGTQAVGSVGSGACAHEGEGYHTYAPAQAETNYDLIAFTFKGTGAVPVTVQVYTRVDANVLTAAGTAWNSGAITEGTFSTTAGSFAPLGIIDQGTAQSATSTGLVLRAGASFADNVLRNCVVAVYGSTQGYWQAPRLITANALSGDTVTVDPAWEVTPSGTIEYKIYGAPADLTTPPAVNLTQISGDSAAADNLEAVLDGTGGVTLVADLTGNIDGSVAVASALGSGSVNADALAADAVSEIWSAGTRTLTAGTNINGSTFTSIPWNPAWDAEVQSECADALAAYDPPTKAELDAAESNIRGADGDTLKTLSDQIDGLSTAAAPQLLLNTTIATLASQTSFTLTAGSPDNDAYNGAVVVVTDQSTSTQKAVGLISDYVGSTRTVTLSADPGVFAMAVGDTVDVLANITSAPTVTQIRQEIDSNSTQLAAIVADTNELQTDWANGGRLDVILDARASQATADAIAGYLDTEVAAIKAKTDQLTFTVANQVDANAESINATAVNGAGTSGNKWRGA